MNRRNFFGLFAAAVATAIVVPELELLVPKRTFFLPPVGGWVGGRNQLLTIEMITAEALRVLSQNMGFMGRIDREYAPAFLETSDNGGKTFRAVDEVGRSARMTIRRPPRYDIRVGDKITIEGVT